MKRWSTDRRRWLRVPRQHVEIKRVGSTTLVYLKALVVKEPLSVTCCGQRVKIMDTGYKWLFICQAGARHITTAHCDAEGEPVHWYIDVIASWGIDSSGFPYFDDLYLDVVALPNGQVEVVDQDELETALAFGVINRAQVDLAWAEAKAVAAAIRSRTFGPVQLTRHYLGMFQS